MWIFLFSLFFFEGMTEGMSIPTWMRIFKIEKKKITEQTYICSEILADHGFINLSMTATFAMCSCWGEWFSLTLMNLRWGTNGKTYLGHTIERMWVFAESVHEWGTIISLRWGTSGKKLSTNSAWQILTGACALAGDMGLRVCPCCLRCHQGGLASLLLTCIGVSGCCCLFGHCLMLSLVSRMLTNYTAVSTVNGD